MRNFGKALILSLVSLCAVSTAHAATPLTLTCYTNGSTTLTVPILSLFLDTGSSEYFSVSTDITHFDGLVFQSFFTSYFDYCAVSGDMRTFPSVVTLESVAGNISPTGNYTQLTFSYKGLTATNGPALTPIAKPAQTADEKAKSLAAFMARVPPPVIVQK